MRGCVCPGVPSGGREGGWAAKMAAAGGKAGGRGICPPRPSALTLKPNTSNLTPCRSATGEEAVEEEDDVDGGGLAIGRGALAGAGDVGDVGVHATPHGVVVHPGQKLGVG